MSNKRKTILGISPGTHTTGLALIKNNDLFEWRVKVFNEIWTEVKLERILLVIEALINKNRVEIIVLKEVDKSRSSNALKQLEFAIKTLAKDKNIPLCTYSIDDIKRECSKGSKSDKGVIVEYVLCKHPELNREYHKELGNKNPYYIKVFEAIAMAQLYNEKYS